MTRKQVFQALCLVIILTVIGTLQAQTLTSRVEGTVKDPSGGVIPGVTVRLTNAETNVARDSVTNEAGLYVFPQVVAGVYNVSAETSGFKVATVQGIRVEVSIPATVDFNLEVGGVSEQVVVSATQGQAVLNTVNAELNTIVNREQIQDLPLNGRNVLDLAMIQPGVTGGSESSRETSINGMRGTFNNLTLDGVNNQDNFIRTDAFFGVIPLRDSFVQEFNLTTQNSDVDSGMGSSQTLLVTRSGSNAYHGEVFYYHRNDALNANTFFNNKNGVEKERVRNHQFGGNLGGTIIPDKLFFFVNYEKERDPATASVTRDVLTGTARQGIYTYTDTAGQQRTVNLFQLTGLTPDPAITGLLANVPEPNDLSTGDGTNIAGFRFNSPNKSDQDWFNLRLDYELSDAHSITGTFHQFRLDLPNDPTNGIDAPFPGLGGAGQNSTRRLGSLAWRSNLTTTLTNEARFGVQWAPVDFVTNETFPLGYQVLLSDPTLGESDLFTNPMQTFMAQGRNAPVYDFADSANWVAGNHTFRLGGNYRRVRVESFNEAGILPQYILGFGAGETPIAPSQFPGGISDDDFANAEQLLGILSGNVRTATETFNVTSQTSGYVPGAREERTLRQNFFSLFGADTWRIRPDLTLNFGLRWEVHGVPTEENGLALLPVGSVLDPEATVDFAGEGTGRDFFEPDWNNFAPNIGFAWRMFGDDRTVLRGGYSINYVIDNNMTTVENAIAQNAGLNQEVRLAGTGPLSAGGAVTITPPEFQIPRSARAGLAADPTAALFAINPNLVVPYVQQWNIGIQREIFPDTAVEVRYVGNRGIKLTRAVDLNQVLLPQEFVEDFRRAQRNLAASGDPYLGEALTIFPQLGLQGFLDDPGVQSWIRTGQIGQYVGNLLALNREFFFAGDGGEEFGASLPAGYFLPNPSTFVADEVDNNAFSKYNSFQAEIRRRFSKGFAGQFNYTYGKVLTNFSGSQSNFRGYFDNRQQNLEIMRPDYDITHTFNGNFLWQIPVGAGRALSTSGILDAIVGGWNTNGILRVRAGEVVNIVSERGTINRGGTRATTNTVNLTGLTIPELQERTGVFFSGDRVLLFDPSLIGPDGRGNPEFFANPGLLEAGTLALSPVSGPWYATFDLGVRKDFRLPINEESRIQVRFDFFNLFNRSNFNVNTQPEGARGNDSLGVPNRHNINSAQFGEIDSTFSARQAQVGLRVVF